MLDPKYRSRTRFIGQLQQGLHVNHLRYEIKMVSPGPKVSPGPNVNRTNVPGPQRRSNEVQRSNSATGTQRQVRTTSAGRHTAGPTPVRYRTTRTSVRRPVSSRKVPAPIAGVPIHPVTASRGQAQRQAITGVLLPPGAILSPGVHPSSSSTYNPFEQRPAAAAALTAGQAVPAAAAAPTAVRAVPAAAAAPTVVQAAPAAAAVPTAVRAPKPQQQLSTVSSQQLCSSSSSK